MRCANRDHVAHTGVAAELAQPRANSQASHAVPDEQDASRCGLLELHDRRLDGSWVMVDRAKHGFQVYRNERHVACAQLAHPGIPKAAVADKSVYEHHAVLADCTFGNMVQFRLRAEGLAPKENAWGGEDLAKPRAQQLDHARARRGAVLLHHVQRRELDRQEERVAEQHQGGTGRPPAGMPVLGKDRGPEDRSH